MPSLVDLLGSSLIQKDGKTVETFSLMGECKVVGLYFSAHWCPPCTGFTPKLVDFYQGFKQRTDKADSLEIVYISSDKDEEQFTEYFNEMPWLAVPYSERDFKTRLSKKFKVQNIPTLVFIDSKTGRLITTDGRNNVLDDPEGQNFPWHPRPLSDILKGPLRCATGDVEADQVLKGKIKGLYFSAHWCPPCRGFTPALIEVYNKLRMDGKNFEVVFVSSDRSPESFDDYFSTMPWLAIPYQDPRISDLTKYFGVQGIPTFILLDAQNEIITTNGRGVVARDPEGKDFPWPPKPLNELNDVTAPYLNESPCLVFFTDGEEENMKQAQEVLKDIAHKYTEEQNASKNSDNELPELYFLYEGEEGEEVADSLRHIADLEDYSPQVAILDIVEQQVHSMAEKEINPQVLSELVSDYKSGKLQFRPLSSR